MSRLSYCDDLLHYQRRLSREVMVGRVGVGGANPIRVQSMILIIPCCSATKSRPVSPGGAQT